MVAPEADVTAERGLHLSHTWYGVIVGRLLHEAIEC